MNNNIIIKFISKLFFGDKKEDKHDEEFDKELFKARRLWIEGVHNEENIWANWKFDQALLIKKSRCGSFEYWLSIAPTNSTKFIIEQKVEWAENTLWHPNLKHNVTLVSGYFRKDGTHVSSHLRKL